MSKTKSTKKTSSKKEVVTKAPAASTAAKKTVKEPKTMEELLGIAGYDISVPTKGETITGLVTNVSRKMVLVDIGAKTEGMVVDKEYESARDFIESVNVGDEVDVYVVSEENDKGQILLSLRRAMSDKLWEMLERYSESGEEVNVRGSELNRGGMIVKWQGLRGFVPSSQFGVETATNLNDLIGKNIRVKVIEVDKEKNRLIFSEKHVSEADLLKKREEALGSVKVGEVYEGTVSGLMSFGAFVSVVVPLTKDEKGKIEGLVHISEVSWEKVNDLNEYLKVGDKVKVKVLGIEEGTGKLNLSLKQLSPDPWDDADKRFEEGKKVKGTVSRVAPFGIFVNFEPGVDGLIHISKIPAGQEMKPGEAVEVFVENLDKEHRRMSLGLVLTEVPVGYK